MSVPLPDEIEQAIASYEQACKSYALSMNPETRRRASDADTALHAAIAAALQPAAPGVTVSRAVLTEAVEAHRAYVDGLFHPAAKDREKNFAAAARCRDAMQALTDLARAPVATHDPVVAMHDAAPLDDEPVTDDDRRAIAEGWAAYQSAPGVTVSRETAERARDWFDNYVADTGSVYTDDDQRAVDEITEALARTPGAEDEENGR